MKYLKITIPCLYDLELLIGLPKCFGLYLWIFYCGLVIMQTLSEVLYGYVLVSMKLVAASYGGLGFVILPFTLND